MMLLAAVLVSAIYVENVEMRVGDSPEWQRVQMREIPQVNDQVWLRANVDLSTLHRPAGRPLGIYFGGMASHELFWDGVLLARGGVVARTKEGERPGPIEAHYQIPDRLATPGVHSLLLRTSAFHRGFSPLHGYWNVVITDYDTLLTLRTRSAHSATIALSGIVLTAIFSFALFFVTRRDRSFLLLGTLCLAAAAMLIVEAWRPLFGYTYDWHIVRLRTLVACAWLIGVQLVALVVMRFPYRHERLVIGVTMVLATIAPFIPRGWDPKLLLMFLICCTIAAAWTAFAAVRRMHGSMLALIGVGIPTLMLYLRPRLWLDTLAFFALDFLFICLLCSHALEVRREQQEKARLQFEMMRRHMQPHFLMNTLTALSEWIEQEPKTAVRMIESLSDELRILSDMSTRKLVTAEDELRLCRSHLANMSLRKDVAYELEVDGVDGTRMVPPAIFHTLVENAITHSPGGRRVVMRLSARQDAQRVRYVFEAPNGGSTAARSSGAGTRYIEARLREAWGNSWRFTQGASGATWRTEIEVPA
jgi:hypothetical protein